MNGTSMEERIFSWSLDGFGSTLFRITEDGRERFVNRYSSMEAEDKYQEEVLPGGAIEYSSFAEFWSAFTDQPFWLHFRPEFVHNDYKPFLQGFFSKFSLGSMTMSEQFRVILWLHKIEL
jgi:hypothetical protein